MTAHLDPDDMRTHMWDTARDDVLTSNSAGKTEMWLLEMSLKNARFGESEV